MDCESFLSVYRHRGCERWDGSTTKREYTFCEQGNPNLSSFLNFSINNSCLPHSFMVDFVLSCQLKDSGVNVKASSKNDVSCLEFV